MPTIDLRSDTMSRPTPEMWRAMAVAEVGDDVYGEDPTVNRLEAMAAKLLGKEAAVFVSSGMMANLVGGLAYCKQGDEILVGSESHIAVFEGTTIAALGGVRVHTVTNDALGMVAPDEVDAAIRVSRNDLPKTSVVCLENTHNRSGGTVLDSEDIGAIAEVAHRHGVPLYLDGARIFNAAVALGISPSELVGQADTVSFCLSKGLGCPAGSMVCGSKSTIAEARKYKKMLGGGMRQVGILAAAGVVALDTMVERLVDDHANAKRLAQGLARMPGLSLDPNAVQTNIVLFELVDRPAQEFIDTLKERGVLINRQAGGKVRMLLHPDIGRDDIDEVLNVVETVANARSSPVRR